MQYESNSLGFGKILLILLVIGIIFIISLFYFQILTMERFFSWFNYQPTAKSIMESSFKPNSISNTIQSENCKTQAIPTQGENSPISISRIGYSLDTDCCLDQISGWECGKQEPSIFYRCSTADVNGQLKYILYQGNFLDLNLGMSLIKSLKKNAWSC